ncbi:MAG: Rab family GTPase [Candidatus Heimdallarchaeota archaeon]
MSSPQKFKYPRVMMKLLLIGSLAVGKTSLIIRFVQKKFKRSVKPTIGANFLVKEFNTEALDGNLTTFILQIWDLAGYHHATITEAIARRYYMGADGVFFCYDLTRAATLEDIRTWKQDLEDAIPYGKVTPILIGNKNDLVEEREIEESDGKVLAKEIGAIDFLETSAKTGHGVEKAFHNMALNVWKRKLGDS